MLAVLKNKAKQNYIREYKPFKPSSVFNCFDSYGGLMPKIGSGYNVNKIVLYDILIDDLNMIMKVNTMIMVSQSMIFHASSYL